MFLRILKKDLKRKKGINIILFLFMIIATVFVASSVNNILVVSNASEYCMNKGNVPDKYVVAYESENQPHIDTFLDSCEYVEDYSKNSAVMISQNNIKSFGGKEGSEYNTAGTIMVQPQWQKHMKIFDYEGNEFTINDGEIALQKKEMDNNGLKIGDKMVFKFGDKEMTFTIVKAVKDPGFGGDFVGMTRLFMSDADYKEITDTGIQICYNYCIDNSDNDVFTKEMNKQGFNIIVAIDKSMFSFSYVMSMITAGLLIVVGVCLIIISFLILRFTIVFTLQEDYKEIGIMKAIGIKNGMIKNIYLVKYFMLVALASIIGFFISIPVSDAMLKGVSKSMLMESGSANIGINILCALGVMMLVLSLCYLSTNRLKKYSAIEAIRSGQTGERFSKKSAFSLHRHKTISTPLFMAINDIFSNIKRYVVLLLTFAIGTIVIILPLNTLSSMGSKEMAKNFAMDTESDFYIGSDSLNEKEDENILINRNFIENRITQLTAEMKDKGYDCELNTLVFYSFSFYTDNPDEVTQIMVMQPVASDGSYIELVEGKTPVLENEIALSENQLDRLGITVGDTVHMRVNGETKDMIVTASYQNYMQMGESGFINSVIDYSDLVVSGCWNYQGKISNIDNKDSKDNIVEELSNTFPKYKFYDMDGAMGVQLGGTVEQISNIKYVILAVICLVNLLITVLMMKIFLISEKGQVAMLRSIGFTNNAIRRWQVYRIGIILVLSVIIGILFSIPLNSIALKPIFGMMGATHMHIQVNVFETYIIYPLILLVVIVTAAYVSSRSIKKLNIMEINNVE